MALKLKNVAESLGRSLVLKHAKFVNGEAKEVKTDSGSIIEGAGMWIVGLLGVALFLFGFRDIIGNTVYRRLLQTFKRCSQIYPHLKCKDLEERLWFEPFFFLFYQKREGRTMYTIFKNFIYDSVNNSGVITGSIKNLAEQVFTSINISEMFRDSICPRG